ncbi:MAG TPA: lipopolysaccharide biosynthesis protein [Solirubrobacterales bacterium]
MTDRTEPARTETGDPVIPTGEPGTTPFPPSSDPGGTPLTPPDDEPGMQEAFGYRLSRDATTYLMGAVITFVLALVSIIVVTRFLSPAEFGELALLMTFAAFLTVIYNVGVLQGTFSYVFGSAGEEELDDEPVDAAAAGTKRRALGTGLITTFLLTTAGTAVIVAFAPWFAEHIVGGGKSGLVVIAAISGASGAWWRMVSNILRMERKPRRYVQLHAVRPILVVGCVIPLVAAGGGVEGAILGTAIGGVLAVLVGLVVTRRSFELAFSAFDARMILRRGRVLVPIVISVWIAQNVDIYSLSWFANKDQVGLYRLASRLGAFLDYFTAALWMAWSPLRRSATFEAAVAERTREVLSGKLLTYFVIAGALLVLLMTVTADTLVRIAPPAYSAAAPLIPLMGTAFLCYGVLVAVYRLSTYPKKYPVYVGAAITSAGVFLASALLLVPWLGAYGAGLSVITGFLTGAAGLTYVYQHGPNPLKIEWGKIAAAVAIGGGCVALARVLGPLAGSLRPAVELVALAIFPIAILRLGIISSDDRRAVGRVIRQLLPRRSQKSPQIDDRVRSLDPDAARTLEMVAVQGSPMAGVADNLGIEVDELEIRLVRSLRSVGGTRPTDEDQRIAGYLFSDLPVAERDAMARALWTDGVDPADLHRLERTLEELRKVSKQTWAEATSAGDQDATGDRGPADHAVARAE